VHDGVWQRLTLLFLRNAGTRNPGRELLTQASAPGLLSMDHAVCVPAQGWDDEP
jgi:hypothetical protein